MRGSDVARGRFFGWYGWLYLLWAVCAAQSALAAPPVLQTVRERGHVLCGITADSPGLATVDGKGTWSGLGAEYCGALAAAVLGSKSAVKIIPLTASERFRALANGSVDVLIPYGAWTLSRDTDLGVLSAGVLFHDGQGFLVNRGDAVTSVLELSGSSICVLSGTRAEQAVSDFFKSQGMKFQAVVAEHWADLVKAYEGGSCTLLTGDKSMLAFERSRLSKPVDHILLPELITKEPIGPVVREGDQDWFRIVRWTLMALVAAEELGITSENVEDMQDSPVLEVRRLLGTEQNLGVGLSLPADWAFQMIKQVGNYGEMFERNLGSKSVLRLERGLDALWTRGGLMYAAPFR